MSKCFACQAPITWAESNYSADMFDYELCRSCQGYIRDHETDSTTGPNVWLWIELRSRGVPVKLEKWDGHKTIDLAIPDARCNIEVDGRHHQNFRQAFADLRRMRHSLQKGFLTIHVPNSLISEARPREMDDIIDELVLCLEAIRDLKRS